MPRHFLHGVFAVDTNVAVRTSPFLGGSNYQLNEYAIASPRGRSRSALANCPQRPSARELFTRIDTGHFCNRVFSAGFIRAAASFGAAPLAICNWTETCPKTNVEDRLGTSIAPVSDPESLRLAIASLRPFCFQSQPSKRCPMV